MVLNNFLLFFSIFILKFIDSNCTLLYGFDYQIQIKAWVEKGYYYSHRCQVNVQVTSNYFNPDMNIYHISSKQNGYFFHTQNYFNWMYVKGTNGMQWIQKPVDTYCKFLTSPKYYCALFRPDGYNPANLNYYQNINSTHRKVTFRIPRALCPSEGQIMSYRIQTPIQDDYSAFYMYTVDISQSYNDPQKYTGKLRFAYDKQVLVDTSLLTYKQAKKITLPNAVNYLLNCKFFYSVMIRFQNSSYYDSFDQIQIIITNGKILELSQQCQTTNMLKNNTCQRTSTGYKLINLNQTDLLKSVEISQSEYYYYPPIEFNITFVGKFISSGAVDIEIICRSFNNKIQQTYLNLSFDSTKIYGRKIGRFQGLDTTQFSKIQAFSTKYDPLNCILPINNQTIDPNFIQPTIPFSFVQTNPSKVGLIFIPVLIIMLIFTIYCRQQIYIYQKASYILLIFIISLIKVIYLLVGIDSSYLTNKPSDSQLITANKGEGDSLQLFIIKHTFILQMVLNLFYFLTYLILLIFSKEITNKIKKFYGKFSFQKGKQIKKCNLSSCIFGSVTFALFLLSYKFYALFIFKLHLNTNDKVILRKYRFHNPILYKIHQGHLIIDLILEINLVGWLYLLTEYCQNPKFNYFLYTLLVLYCLHIYLMVLVMKVLYVMGKITIQFNQTQNNRVKCEAQLIRNNGGVLQNWQQQNNDQQNQQQQNHQNENQNQVEKIQSQIQEQTNKKIQMNSNNKKIKQKELKISDQEWNKKYVS